MDVLWLLGNPAEYYRVPDQHLLVNAAGELTETAAAYRQQIHSADAFSALACSVGACVMGEGLSLAEPDWFDLLPAELPKLMLLTGKPRPGLEMPLNHHYVDAYVSAVSSAADYALILKKVQDDKRALQAMQQELKSFSAIAFTAMSSASEMGTVAIFAEKVQEVMELERLAQLIHACLADLNLNGMVQFIFDDEIHLFPPDISPSYLRLLNLAQDSNARIVSQGRFLLFSFTHLQLLITDAPVNEEERYGRLRDVLAHLVSIAEARAKTLKVNSLLKAQQDNTRTVMMLLEMSSRDNRNAVKNIMTELSDSLRLLATGFDLNMEQESALLELSEKALGSLEGLQETTEAVEEHFRSLVQELDNVAHLLDAPDAAVQHAEEHDSRIELF
jgi:cell division septum initiation protein DivIVA